MRIRRRLNSAPVSPEPYFFRGLAYQQGLSRYDDAIADYEVSIRLNPALKDGLAFSNRGIIYQSIKQDYHRAIADYSDALKYRPNDATVIYNRGMSRKAVADPGGDADVARAKELNPRLGQ